MVDLLTETLGAVVKAGLVRFGTFVCFCTIFYYAVLSCWSTTTSWAFCWVATVDRLVAGLGVRRAGSIVRWATSRKICALLFF